MKKLFRHATVHKKIFEKNQGLAINLRLIVYSSANPDRHDRQLN